MSLAVVSFEVDEASGSGEAEVVASASGTIFCFFLVLTGAEELFSSIFLFLADDILAVKLSL